MSVKFKAKFNDDCEYTGNNDWNKLMKVSITPPPTDDINSIRLGWRWVPMNEPGYLPFEWAKIEMGLYAHINNFDILGFPGREFTTLRSFVPLNQFQDDIELILATNGVFARAGDNALAIRHYIE